MEYVFYLTNNCNLKCKYCYECDKSKNNNKMDFSIIKHLLSEQAKKENDTTSIGFFGGEPLLQKQLIYDTVNLGKDLFKLNKHNFVYSVTTNGTLIDDEFINFCKKNNILVGISIDGNEYTHNLNREAKDNKNYFDIVLGNAKKCLEAKVNCMALPVICTNNVEFMADNIQFLIDLGFKKITCNFNYYDKWDDDLLKILKQQYEDVSNIYYNEFKKKNYIRIYPLDTKMQLHIHEKNCSEVCNKNRIAVNVDGKFYPCIQFVGNNLFEIGDYKNGIDYGKRKEIINKRITSKVICEECELKNRCLYKCGCARLITTNDIIEVSPLNVYILRKQIILQIDYIKILKKNL